MTELSPVARALIDAARDGLAPDAEALRRVRGRIDSAVVPAGGAVVAKLAIVAGIAAIVAGAIALRREDVAAPALSFGSSAIVETHEQRAHEGPPPVMHIEMPETNMARGDVARARDDLVPAVETRHEPAVVEPPRGVDLAREVELVDAAMASLSKGDAAAALASVRLHRAETNNRGQLAEDAAAIEIEALCRLRDHRVVAKLEAFDTRWPESAQRSRLTTSCP